MDKVIFATYNGLIVVALAVFLLSVNMVISKGAKRMFDDAFCFSLAIAVAWLGTLSIRLWFSMYWYTKFTDGDINYYTEHWLVTVFISLIMMGGVLHVRTLTKDRYGDRLWLAIFGTSLLVSIISYFLVL